VWELLAVLLSLLCVGSVVLPIVVYFCIKFGTVAYYVGRRRFMLDYAKENGDGKLQEGP
jgi:hypothetical protein